MPNLYVGGVKKDDAEGLKKKIEEVFLESTNNLSWLSKGDLVLLKPSLNSPCPYPATTHPEAVHVIYHILKRRGARVIVGDQPGVEYVVHHKDMIKGCSSKKLFEESGMAKKGGVNFSGFEEEGWGHYVRCEGPSWPNGFYVTRWIERADHVISLPRVSAHASSGVTLGFKNMVGILRDDSRLVFHKDGPFLALITASTRRVGLTNDDQGQNLFIPKITEISLAIKDKLRLTLFVGTKAQTTLGPDEHLLGVGKLGILHSYVVTPQTGLVFASSHPVASEAFAIAFLIFLYSQTPRFKKFIQKAVLLFNSDKTVKELGKEGVWDNPFIKHALKVGLGEKIIEPLYTDVPEDLQKSLSSLLKQ